MGDFLDTGADLGFHLVEAAGGGERGLSARWDLAGPLHSG